jgi:RNA polymerase sigma factor (sigma-70 family)
MERDSGIGGPAGFPTTRLSAIVAARSDRPEERARAHGAIVAAYWKPAYKYVRRKWNASREDAEDLIQGFFTRALEKPFFERFEPGRARFRTYLRVCLDGFVANQRKAERRLKRGGGATLLSLDFEDAEGELRRHEPPVDDDPDAYFEREWTRHLFAQAVESLRRDCETEGREARFQVFRRYDLEDHAPGEAPSYADLAVESGLPVTTVTNHLAWARREFRRRVLKRLRELCLDDDEYRSEARRMLGVELP